MCVTLSHRLRLLCHLYSLVVSASFTDKSAFYTFRSLATLCFSVRFAAPAAGGSSCGASQTGDHGRAQCCHRGTWTARSSTYSVYSSIYSLLKSTVSDCLCVLVFHLFKNQNFFKRNTFPSPHIKGQDGVILPSYMLVACHEWKEGHLCLCGCLIVSRASIAECERSMYTSIMV